MVFRSMLIGLTLLATPAVARQMPEPPPSGVVVHLFGPGSVASNILPSLAPSAPATPGAAPAVVEPSANDVLHQMFITGDPSEPASAKLPKGRPGEEN